MAKDQDSSGDFVSQLAREARERREQAEKESTRPRPKFIESIEQSEVIYTVRPSAMPLSQVDINRLNESLVNQFNLRLLDPDFSPLLTKVPRDQLARMSEEELLSRLVREDDALFGWGDGRFPLRDDFVPIKSVKINYESILVAVAGVSQVAEVIAKEVIELMWALAGSKKRFTDLQPAIQMIGYGTGTRLNLESGAESLLNPLVLQFLDANLAQGNNYVASMGRTRIFPDNQTVQFNAIAALDDLTIRISKYDPVTGFTGESEVRFSVTAKNDYRLGRIRVTSELPYEEHVKFLTNLFETIGRGA